MLSSFCAHAYVYGVYVSSGATHFISFSVDSNAKRNFIAFQSNNNKFVPIDLWDQLHFSSLPIRFPLVHALATSTFAIRFALDGVKYSMLCLLKLTIQRFMRSLLFG